MTDKNHVLFLYLGGSRKWMQVLFPFTTQKQFLLDYLHKITFSYDQTDKL